MSNETTNAVTAPETQNETPSAEMKRTLSAQSRASIDLLIQTGEMLGTLASDDELSALMNAAGYTSPQLAVAEQLRATAHTRFLTRQAAMARHKSAAFALERTLGAALVTYRDLRAIARNAFDESDRIALSIQGPFPQDRAGFAQTARAFYETALAEPVYRETLAAQGVSQARLADALTELDSFNTALIEHEIARADALRATAERDTAVLALRDWRTRFRRRARIATRGRRDLQAKLAL